MTYRWAAWALTGQICLVYWFAVLTKTDPLWTQNHNALFFALSMEDLTSPLGIWMRQFPDLLHWLTIATLCMEALGPLLLFIPFYRDRFRFLAVILFFFFHLVGMQGLLRLGFFPWVCAAAWLIFIPGFFWNVVTGSNLTRVYRGYPTSRTLLLDRIMVAIVWLSFADILVWNAVCLHPGQDTSPSEAWLKKHDPWGMSLHINQHWRMYSSLHTPHGWLIAPAELADGTHVDIFTSQAISYSKPRDVAGYLGKDRWRSYIADLTFNRDSERLRQYADYLTNKWNENHPENQRVKSVTLIFMKQTTQSDLTFTAPEQDKLFEHTY